MFYRAISLTMIAVFLIAGSLFSFNIGDLTGSDASSGVVSDVQATSADPVVEPTASTRSIAYVNVNSSLNLRSTPSTSGRIIASLTPNTVLTINRAEGSWTNVTIPDGRSGWVSSRYIGYRVENTTTPAETTVTPPRTETPPSGTTGTQQPAERTGRITASSLNVRSGPGTENGRVGTVSNGTSVTIIGEQNGWYQVRYGNGQTGWVSGRYVSTTGGGSGTGTGTGTNTGTTTGPTNGGGSTNGILNVPTRRQGVPENTMNGIYFGGAWCGPTSAGMVGDYFGINRTTRQWAIDCNYNYGNFTERNPNRRVGTPITGIRDGLRNAGLTVDHREGASMTWLRDAVAANKPIIVSVNTIWAGHYIVVKGFRNGKVVVNDPAQGGEREFSESYFMTMWRAKGCRGLAVSR